jgi:DNA-3-methyladenine glycosylase
VTPGYETGRSAAPPGARRSLHALPLDFYTRPAEEVARDLLGRVVVSEIGGVRSAGEIVEVEAYVGPHDEASHAHERFGRTARNTVMFGHPGLAYVYRIYGIHWCLNAVTDVEGFPAAVLIRALRPVEGLDVARARRAGRPDRDLMRGPGNLCRALGITGEQNGHPLQVPPLWIDAGREVPDAEVAAGPRIGITRAADWPLRFWIPGSVHVSASRTPPRRP